jgi:diphthamide synthase (EF-2-diphthine--ammonia ligase)
VNVVVSWSGGKDSAYAYYLAKYVLKLPFKVTRGKYRTEKKNFKNNVRSTVKYDG